MLIALAILPALTNAAPTMVNIGENDIGRGEDALGGGTHRQQNDTRAARQKRSISWIMTVVGQDCGQACEARGEQCTDGVWPILTRDAMDAAAAPYGLACGSYLRGSSFRNPMMMSIADGRRNCYWDAGNSSCESAATGASSRRFCPCEKEPLKYRCELQSAGLPSCVESPDGLDIETCESICGPAPLYRCIGDTCIRSEGGVDLGTCLSVCGDHNSTGH
jgi:hypothetical protein